MILVDYQGAGVAVAAKAKAQNIPVIAYDRPITGADYYVSFDNFTVGALEGQSIVDGLTAAGKDPKTAIVIYMGGDPTTATRSSSTTVLFPSWKPLHQAAAEPAGILGWRQVGDKLRAGSDLDRWQG